LGCYSKIFRLEIPSHFPHFLGNYTESKLDKSSTSSTNTNENENEMQKKKAKKKKKKGTHLIERSVSERVVELPRPTARERYRICFQRIVLCWGHPDFYLGNVGLCFLLVLPVSSPSFFSF
jgi:hypothetical protein